MNDRRFHLRFTRDESGKHSRSRSRSQTMIVLALTLLAMSTAIGVTLFAVRARAATIGNAGTVLAAVTAPVAAEASTQATFDLTALMALLSRIRSGEATFTEQRTVRTLDAPLVSSGTLSFAAPDRFTRNTLKPRPESMSVDGNVVTLTRAGRSRTFALDAVPEMTGLVEAVRGTLTGNADTVRRYFKTEVTGRASDWLLTLTPLESRIGGQVRQIQISGSGSELSRIEMRLTDGDYSVMAITPSAAATKPAQ